MPSHLRLQSTFSPVPAKASYQTSPTLPPAKKQKMSLTQTYYVASTARSKLGREAARGDHNLRRLVGHANLLDTLMVELADAEREQEAWFNSVVSKNNASRPAEPRHVQWIDTIAEAVEEDDDEDFSDSDDDSDVDDDELFNIPLRKVRSPPVQISSAALDYDYDDEDMEDDSDDSEFEDDEYDEAHALQRVASQHSPPELTLDSDSDSEEDESDSMPPSPEPSQDTFATALGEKQSQSTIIATTASFFDAKSSQPELDGYLAQQHLIAAC